MHVQRRLFRALLRQIHQFRRDGLPLLGLAGSEGEALLQSWSFPAYDVTSILKSVYQQGAGSGPHTTDTAITALRILASQRRTLVGVEEHTRQACRAWQRLLHSQHDRLVSSGQQASNAAAGSWQAMHQQHVVGECAPARHAGSVQGSLLCAALPPHGHQQLGRTAQEQDSRAGQRPQQLAAATWPIATGLEHTALLIQQLQDDMQLSGLEEDMALTEEGHAGDINTQQGEILQALNTRDFTAAVDVMAQHVQQQHRSLFSSIHDTATHQHDSVGCSADVDLVTKQLRAVQEYLYNVLKLRHEPIEWVYDGLGPLLPAAALKLRKAAPFTLAVLATTICGRLGIPAVPIRASSTTQHAPPTQDALATGTMMPEDVAVRQANRAASYVPTDPWVVAAVHAVQHDRVTAVRSHQHAVHPQQHGTNAAANQEQQSAHLPTSAPGFLGAQPHILATASGQPQGRSTGKTYWVLSGTYLDVSCRGGAVLDQQALAARHPQALQQVEQAGMRVDPERAYLQICAEWARAVMVAHQRRGESDLVAHWLVQVLALAPSAPEWDAMMMTS